MDALFSGSFLEQILRVRVWRQSGFGTTDLAITGSGSNSMWTQPRTMPSTATARNVPRPVAVVYRPTTCKYTRVRVGGERFPKRVNCL